jgi:hypothetical protein
LVGVAGASWTDNGCRREERQLKHQARDETRIVPCPPALTALLHAHLSEHGTGADGRLFRGVRGGDLAESTTAGMAQGPSAGADRGGGCVPAGRPALQSAARGGVDVAQRRVPSTQVAEWAGHSLAVLLQIYAKCLVGQEEAPRRRIDAVLGTWRKPGAGRTQPDRP